jgi:predicted RNase H-like HicB family nuclease
MDKYPISIKWSDEDGGYIATIPGIQGLSAFGESPTGALTELNIAAKAYFRSLEKAGRQVPRAEKIKPYSGQLRLRMPKSLHADLAQAAENEGVSLNTHIVTLLTKRQSERDLSEIVKCLERMLSRTGSRALPLTVHAEKPMKSS